jgi:hypothetical protein
MEAYVIIIAPPPPPQSEPEFREFSGFTEYNRILYPNLKPKK